MNENTLLFKILINLDRLLNVLTGGTFQECLSTRAYRQSIVAKPRYNAEWWMKVRNFIDWLFFLQDEHCKGSFEWEVTLKAKYVNDNKNLLM